MDDSQKNHLKAYGIAYFILKSGKDVDWLLNYVVKLETAPKIAVYSPKNALIADETDAVTHVLDYAEIPYIIIYDEEVLRDGRNRRLNMSLLYYIYQP